MAMNVISRKTLVAFIAKHPDAQGPLEQWYKHVRHANYTNFSDLRVDYGNADWVKGYIVFNIGGNKYRLIVTANFWRKTIFIKHVLSHKEYDDWRPE